MQAYSVRMNRSYYKGLAETVADALDVKFTYKPAQKPFLHPYQTAEVFCDGKKSDISVR